MTTDLLKGLLAAGAGYAVHQLLVHCGGVSAALATPAGYFEAFGREHLRPALGL